MFEVFRALCALATMRLTPWCTREDAEAAMSLYSYHCFVGTRLRAFYVPILLLVCVVAYLPAFAQTTAWLGGTGNWSNPGKWSAGVPTGTSTALIDNGNGAASPVTLDVN